MNNFKKYPVRKLIENDPYKDEPEEFTDETSLFIGDLSRTVTEDMLREHFQDCGGIKIVDIKRDKVTKNNLGYGFVKFNTREDAEKAKISKNQTSLQGRIIRVGWAQKNTNLFVCLVGDENNKIDGKQLRKIFCKFGPIYANETFVKPNKYGFVKFKHRIHAEQAKASLDGQYLPLPDGNRTQRPVRIGWGDANTQRNCVHVQFEQKPASNADINEDDFRQIFNIYGQVVKVSLPRYSDRKLKGYGFIHYAEGDDGEESAARAITALSCSILKGVEITCNFGKRQNQRHKKYAQKREHEQQHFHQQYNNYGGRHHTNEYRIVNNMNTNNIMNIHPNMNMMMINNGIMNNHMPFHPLPIHMTHQPLSQHMFPSSYENRNTFNDNQISQLTQLNAKLNEFTFEPTASPILTTNDQIPIKTPITNINITPLPSISNVALVNTHLPIIDDTTGIMNISPQLANINMDMAGLMNGFLHNHHLPPPPPHSFILPPSPPNPFTIGDGSTADLSLKRTLPLNGSGISSMNVSANVSPTIKSLQALQMPVFPNMMVLPPNMNNFPSPLSGFPSPSMFTSLNASPEPISPPFKLLMGSPVIPTLPPNMMGMSHNPIMMGGTLPPPIINFPPPNPSQFNIRQPNQRRDVMDNHILHQNGGDDGRMDITNAMNMNFEIPSPSFLPNIEQITTKYTTN